MWEYSRTFPEVSQQACCGGNMNEKDARHRRQLEKTTEIIELSMIKANAGVYDPMSDTFSRVLKTAYVNLLWVWSSNLFFS